MTTKELKHFADGFHEGDWERDLEEKKDKCVSCDKDTEYNLHDHVDFRIGYIEGAGQLCLDCYDEIYVKKNKNLYKDNGDGTFQKFSHNNPTD